MLLKVQGEYLDFNDDVEIERQFLLLNDIDSIGDFSYGFNIPITKKNKRILGVTDSRQGTKIIYNNLNTELQNSSGITIYRGVLKVEGVTDTIETSFISGNTDWIEQITGSCLDINFDLVGVSGVAKSGANIISTFTAESGIVFPIIDTGLIYNRLKSDNTIAPTFYEEDFQQCIYAKTVMQAIFAGAGIKLEGELLGEYLYQNLLLSSNNVNGTQDLLNRRSTRASKTSNQSISTSFTQVTFTDDSSFPNYNTGGRYNTSTSEWTADKAMRITAKAYVTLSASATSYLQIKINGVAVGVGSVTGTENTTVLKWEIVNNRPQPYADVEAGDVVTVEFRVTSGSVNVQAGSYFEVTAVSFTDVIPQSILGTMEKTDFVSSVFKMFGVIPSYNAETKTLTCNLLKRLKEHTPKEIKGKVIGEDFTEVLQGYGRQTLFTYEDGEVDQTEDYNRMNDVPYGGGALEIDNDYIEDSEEIPINFCVGYAYSNQPLGTILTRCNFREFEDDGDEVSISSVTDSGGVALFTTSTAHGLSVGDWVLISETSTDEYVGAGKVATTPLSTTFTITGISIGSTATGTMIKQKVIENSSDKVFAFVNISDINISLVTTSLSFIIVEGSLESLVAYAYTALPYNTEISAHNSHKHTIHFQNVNIPGYMQVGLIDNFYPTLKAILNDPVLCKVEALIPEADFLNLSSQTPIKFYSRDGYGLYYLNKITGYKGSHMPCEVELIKLP